jgi:ferredoxin
MIRKCRIITQVISVVLFFLFFKKNKLLKTDELPFDISRRHIISSILLGSVSGALVHTELRYNNTKNNSFVRPPGSIPEDQFLARCSACEACIKACPGKIIQPSGITNGFYMLYTPIMNPYAGICIPDCTICGYICPTQSIGKFTVEEKKYIKIGTASVNRNICLSWKMGKTCLLCKNACPYHAVQIVDVKFSKGSVSAPVVDEVLCVGCGNCSNICPVNRPKAITVSPYGENRKTRGMFVNEAMKSKIDKLRTKNTDSLKNEPSKDDSFDLFIDNIPEEVD